MIKGIIFDLDGTLVRLPIRYDEILKKLQNLFDTRDEFKPLIPTIIEKANNDLILIKKAFDLICDEETMATNNFKIIDDAIDTLNYFKNKNYSICLITMQCMKAAKIVLDKMHVSELFSSVITRDVSFERPFQIKKSVEFLSLSPDQVVVIGDRIHDVHSAKKIGCNPILFNKEKFGSFKESKVISELSELTRINLSL
ncbi:MAG: HAD family hydrolase [Candidatus Nitrosopumilus sp. bin_7KS]